MIAAPHRSYNALECEREARRCVNVARLFKAQGGESAKSAIADKMRSARYWWRCALEARRNCGLCGNTRRHMIDFDPTTGYHDEVDCPDCTAPRAETAPALVDGDTPAGHLRNALQILTLGRALEPYSPMAGDMVAAVSERIHAALRGIEE